MNHWQLIKRSLRYHRRTNLWVVLGAALGVSVLVGALTTGDSIRYSLKRLVSDRLGRTEIVMETGERLFDRSLAGRLAARLNTNIAPLILTHGIAVAGGGAYRMNQITVAGVDPAFGLLGGVPDLFAGLSPGDAIINQQIADRLKLQAGDDVLIRIARVQRMPGEAPFSETGNTIAKRFRVAAVAGRSEFGSFNLRTDQKTPANVFVSINDLDGLLESEGKANVLLIAGRDGLDLSSAEMSLNQTWRLADAGYSLAESGTGRLELRSDRVFIDEAVTRAAREADSTADRVMTYFVNSISHRNRSTPYSFVSALESSLGFGFRPDEIIVNSWLGQDLDLKSGDAVRLDYFVPAADGGLVEEHAVFTVSRVVSIDGLFADRTLLPDFPGLADEENCRDWHPGVPIDLNSIRDKDEAYWDRYRGTPKAFISMQTAQKLWKNRFGTVTGIRFSRKDRSALESMITERMHPGQLGFYLRPVLNEGLDAGAQSVDFAQLFLGLSFFVIIAALMLTGLLFVFNLENRRNEAGLYLALGFPRKLVRRLIVIETSLLLIPAGLIGAVGGLFINQLILFGLKTIWKDAVGTTSLTLHAAPVSLLSGAAAGLLLAFLLILLITGRTVNRSVSVLQRGIPDTADKRVRGYLGKIVTIVSFAVFGVLIVLSQTVNGMASAAVFFAAGGMLLIAFISLSSHLIADLAVRKRFRLNAVTLGIRSIARHRMQSIMLISLLSSTLFIVFTVGSNRIERDAYSALSRQSGTGGFKLVGESSIPVHGNINDAEKRRELGLGDLSLEELEFVSLRKRPGDDASCLNLNRVSRPQLLGVMPEELSERKAFSFAEMAEGTDHDNPWSVLKEPMNVVPGICDQTVIIWGLGMQVGDTLEYIDESGRPFSVKLMGGLENSIFQGNILIDESILIEKYPSTAGYHLFLADCPADSMKSYSDQLSWAMQDYGLDFYPAHERLAEFDRVQNTYLSIFSILGSLGLILGSAGIAIMVWRHVNERRAELALLKAVGFQGKSLRFMLLSEHATLLLAGLLTGCAAAAAAVWPQIGSAGLPWRTLLLLLLFILLNGLIWTWLAVFISTREKLMPALRNQ